MPSLERVSGRYMVFLLSDILTLYFCLDTLCGECKKGRGVTFDLRFCRHCGVGGTVLFVFICECVYMYIHSQVAFTPAVLIWYP